MSMFKTLQNSPATVSIFHNTKLALLKAIYNALEKASRHLNTDKKTQFQIDIMADQLPTYDQFKYLLGHCVAGKEGREVLAHAYPFMATKKVPKEKGSVTTQPPVGLESLSLMVRTFSEGEYGIIQEAFQHLLEERDQNPDHDPLEVFLAPLVVDWDQGLVAGDELSLEHLLQKYEDQTTA